MGLFQDTLRIGPKGFRASLRGTGEWHCCTTALVPMKIQCEIWNDIQHQWVGADTQHKPRLLTGMFLLTSVVSVVAVVITHIALTLDSTSCPTRSDPCRWRKQELP